MRVGSERARVRRALALASLLHLASVAMMGVFATTTRAVPPALAPTPAVAATVEVALDLEAPAPELAHAELAAPQLTAPSARAMRTTGRAPLSSNEPMEAAVVEAAEEAPTADLDSASEPPADRAVDLGLGPDAWRKWASTTAADAQASPRKKRARKSFRAAPASTTGGLQEGLEARDRELGLGPSGPVIGALYRAAHSDIAPQLGTAQFRVTLFSSGAVEVSVSSATDRLAGWSAVAARAAETLRSTPQRIPAQRKGVSMVVEVTAESVFPNGLKRKDLRGPHFEAVAPRLRSAEEGQADLQRLNPTAKEGGQPLILDLPGVYLAETGKVCSYRLGITAAGPVLAGGCDPSHIGAKAQRRVHARVVEEAVF
jgi:hypothetical protein